VTAFDGLRDYEPPPPRPIWVWCKDAIGLLLVAVDAVAAVILAWAILS
jgi:hypothetical protein